MINCCHLVVGMTIPETGMHGTLGENTDSGPQRTFIKCSQTRKQPSKHSGRTIQREPCSVTGKDRGRG